jgi:hypothetical protein
MKYSIDSHNNCYHTIRVTLNGWYIDWVWYGFDVHTIIDTILDQSLTEYINFCFKPDDTYYDSHYYTDTLA